MPIAASTLPRPVRLYPLRICPGRLGFAKPPLFLDLFSLDRHLLPPRMAATPSTDASQWRIGASSSGDGADGSPRRDVPGQLSFDELLSVAEVVCIAPPIVCSIWGLASAALPGASRRFQVSLGSKIFVLQYSLLIGAVVIGRLIRWRQWQRVNKDGGGVGLIGRIEKMEEDMQSSATTIRVLSKQLEKLGIRFRVTRKALKEPIAETAALAQKNSEATRSLAMQEENLEKELGEIQKVLLAMQEQQQKQLELILAIGKAGRLLDTKQNPLECTAGTSNPIPVKRDMEELEAQSGRHAR